MATELSEQFLRIRTRADLAAFLELTLKQLGFFAFSGTNLYTRFSIQKKTPGAARSISAPANSLKAVQGRVALVLSEIYEEQNPPEAVHGFRIGRGTVSNAAPHVKHAVLLNVDLKDFFPSITAGRIRGLFKADPFGFPDEVADALTNIVCHEGSLPQGAPSSPVLSNYICKRMDKQLLAYANKHRVVYTRYADDLTFSSFNERAFRRAFLAGDSAEIQIADAVRRILESNGFTVNKAKTRLATRSSRQLVTGILVNEKCNFTRDAYRELRVLLYNWKEYGCKVAAELYIKHAPRYEVGLSGRRDVPMEKALRNHVRGRLAYYTMVTAGNAKPSWPLMRLWTMYNEITGEDVPIVDPRAAVWQCCANYDYEFGEGEERDCFTGVGSIFGLSTGELVTCAHCVEDIVKHEAPDDALLSIEYGGRSSWVRMADIKRNHEVDLAVLRDVPVEMSKSAGIRANGTYLPQVGETVWAYGYADGENVLRCLEAKVVEIFDDARKCRVDRPFIHGMSGGPVVSSRCEVIGVITNGSAAHDYAYDGAFARIGMLGLLE